jgi:CRP-like cAMP-binding protein
MGDRLDDQLRAMVTSRCTVKQLAPEEILIEAGNPVDGMYVVGVGKIEMVTSGTIEELGPGDFLFPEQVMAAGNASAPARAGEDGALLLYATRMAAHELLVSVPPLLDILAG